MNLFMIFQLQLFPPKELLFSGKGVSVDLFGKRKIEGIEAKAVSHFNGKVSKSLDQDLKRSSTTTFIE